MSLTSEMFRALRAVEHAWETDREDGIDQMGGAAMSRLIQPCDSCPGVRYEGEPSEVTP